MSSWGTVEPGRVKGGDLCVEGLEGKAGVSQVKVRGGRWKRDKGKRTSRQENNIVKA